MTKVLVIGYGNTLRSDDGAGQTVASQVATWKLVHVRSLSIHQLTPELAEPVSEASLVIFVDAYLANEQQRELQIVRVESSHDHLRLSGHDGNPRSILALSEFVYGIAPPAWWVLIPGVNFDLGEEFSEVTKQAIDLALMKIQALIPEN